MSSDHDTPAGSDAEAADEIARLLRAAGRRHGPPPGSYERTLQAARETWQMGLRRRRRVRLFVALAASTALAAVAIWRIQLPEPAAPVASIERTSGSVWIRHAADERWLPASAAALQTGSELRTDAAARAALRLADGTSLRLDHATRVEFMSARALRLATGRVYVDTGTHVGAAAPARAGLHVETVAGTVWDVGTQFEVMLREGVYRIRVREGQVVASRPDGTRIRGSAGDQLLSLSGGAFERSGVDPYDPAWTWIESVAVVPPTDGQPIAVVLDWVTRETGRPIRFESQDVERRVTRAVLHGSIRDLAPLDALRVTLATLDLDYTVERDGAILIRARHSAP